ncbi:MAG: cupin domain-containing protein [Microbacterium sp.]|uniref:cupin domain-containing protein n=1 Tax=Microbacterium sp. TaxID=51671 RepID=UPI003F9CF1E1
MYSVSWEELPSIEGLKNNFRTAVAGKEMGVNRIRWIHPTSLPPHVHDDAEQSIVMLEGEIEFVIGGDRLLLKPGDVAIVPRGIEHSGQSVAGEAVFIEVFAPLRTENLVGFLGEPSLTQEEN